MREERVYGLCVCQRPQCYVIFYRADATLLQQQRILFHELCHIILSHVSPLNPVHVLREPLTATLQEQEAEIFAEVMTWYALASAPTRHTERVENKPADRFTRWLTVIGG